MNVNRGNCLCFGLLFNFVLSVNSFSSLILLESRNSACINPTTLGFFFFFSQYKMRPSTTPIVPTGSLKSSLPHYFLTLRECAGGNTPKIKCMKYKLSSTHICNTSVSSSLLCCMELQDLPRRLRNCHQTLSGH